MVRILNGDYLIVASAQFNPATNFWIGPANITLAFGRKLEWNTLIGPKDRHSGKRDAEHFMISEAKDWIEARRKSHRQPGSRLNEGHHASLYDWMRRKSAS